MQPVAPARSTVAAPNVAEAMPVPPQLAIARDRLIDALGSERRLIDERSEEHTSELQSH